MLHNKFFHLRPTVIRHPPWDASCSGILLCSLSECVHYFYYGIYFYIAICRIVSVHLLPGEYPYISATVRCLVFLKPPNRDREPCFWLLRIWILFYKCKRHTTGPLQMISRDESVHMEESGPSNTPDSSCKGL